MSDWNPEQYRKFATEREMPFWELVDLIDADRPVTSVEGRVERRVGQLVDLGCGDGQLSVDAAARLGASSVLGIDSSPAMIERARRLVSRDGGVRAGRHRHMDR